MKLYIYIYAVIPKQYTKINWYRDIPFSIDKSK